MTYIPKSLQLKPHIDRLARETFSLHQLKALRKLNERTARREGMRIIFAKMPIEERESVKKLLQSL